MILRSSKMLSPEHIESVLKLNKNGFTGSEAANTLVQLPYLTDETEVELAHYAGATHSSSDEEESDSSVMDKFTRVNASTGIIEMLKFGLSEFM